MNRCEFRLYIFPEKMANVNFGILLTSTKITLVSLVLLGRVTTSLGVNLATAMYSLDFP